MWVSFCFFDFQRTKDLSVFYQYFQSRKTPAGRLAFFH